MEKLTYNSIERYIKLNNELAKEDPYVLSVTKDEFLCKQSLKTANLEIFILTKDTKDIGFIELIIEYDTIIIDKIYVNKLYGNSEMYQYMINFIIKVYKEIGYKKIQFIGINRGPVIESLIELDFIIKKEHIQMEKNIDDKYNLSLDVMHKTFCEIGDSNWIFNFMKECMKGFPFSFDIDEINDLINLKNDLALIFFENHQPIGFIISYINEKRNLQENKKVIYIEEVAVLDKFRNKGYGQHMIKQIIDKGNKRGMDIARLHVYRHNEIAYRLYKKIGFSEVKNIGYWIKEFI